MFLAPFLLEPTGRLTRADAQTFKAIFSFSCIYVLARTVQILRRRSFYASLPLIMCWSQIDWCITAELDEAIVLQGRVWDARLALEYLASSAAAAGFAGILSILPAASAANMGMLWLRSLVFGCCGLFGLLTLDTFFQLVWLAHGLQLPSMMDRPWLALSLQEFWSRRWNGMVKRLLHDLVFRPMRRAGFQPAGASFAAFCASGYLHAYPLIMTVGLTWHVAQVFAFFVIEAILVSVERLLLPRLQLTAMWRRVWVFLAVVLPLPLLAVPMMAMSSAPPRRSLDMPEAIGVTAVAVALAFWRSMGTESSSKAD